jgi:hypothetical protein
MLITLFWGLAFVLYGSLPDEMVILKGSDGNVLTDTKSIWLVFRLPFMDLMLLLIIFLFIRNAGRYNDSEFIGSYLGFWYGLMLIWSVKTTFAMVEFMVMAELFLLPLTVMTYVQLGIILALLTVVFSTGKYALTHYKTHPWGLNPSLKPWLYLFIVGYLLATLIPLF